MDRIEYPNVIVSQLDMLPLPSPSSRVCRPLFCNLAKALIANVLRSEGGKTESRKNGALDLGIGKIIVFVDFSGKGLEGNSAYRNL